MNNNKEWTLNSFTDAQKRMIREFANHHEPITWNIFKATASDKHTQPTLDVLLKKGVIKESEKEKLTAVPRYYLIDAFYDLLSKPRPSVIQAELERKAAEQERMKALYFKDIDTWDDMYFKYVDTSENIFNDILMQHVSRETIEYEQDYEQEEYWVDKNSGDEKITVFPIPSDKFALPVAHLRMRSGNPIFFGTHSAAIEVQNNMIPIVIFAGPLHQSRLNYPPYAEQRYVALTEDGGIDVISGDTLVYFTPKENYHISNAIGFECYSRNEVYGEKQGVELSIDVYSPYRGLRNEMRMDRTYSIQLSGIQINNQSASINEPRIGMTWRSGGVNDINGIIEHLNVLERIHAICNQFLKAST